MSYILNALRKSERERQATEPDSIAERIVVQHTPRHRSAIGLIVALVAINVVILAYFLGFVDRSTPPVAEPVVAAKPVETTKSVITAPTTSANQAAALKPAVEMPKPKAKLPPAHTVADKKSVATVSEAMAPAKTAESKKVADVVSPLVKEADSLAQEPNTNTSDAAKPAVQEAIQKPVDNKPDKVITEIAELDKPPVAPKPQQIPFLDELPYEFQLSLPTMSINVFSYSEIPSERFVMIDMVKYVPGQSIKDLLAFQEIHSDGIVVVYKGRTFKIRRP